MSRTPPRPNRRSGQLVVLTASGWEAIHAGREIIARIEADYAQRIGPKRYTAMCWALQDLLDDLHGGPLRGAEQAREHAHPDSRIDQPGQSESKSRPAEIVEEGDDAIGRAVAAGMAGWEAESGPGCAA